MAKLQWDQSGDKKFELGISNGVLYVKEQVTEGSTTVEKWVGHAWNGLISVSESPEGAEANDIYADNIKYGSFLSAENLKATIEAYTYPDEFMQCDGSAEISYGSGDSKVGGVYMGQQDRKAFCLVYVTQVGDDTNQSKGKKIHILYNCKASPSERAYETINDSPEAITFSWEVSCTPEGVTGDLANMKPTALVTVDETKFNTANHGKFDAIWNALFGSTSTDPTVLTPNGIYDILKATD